MAITQDDGFPPEAVQEKERRLQKLIQQGPLTPQEMETLSDPIATASPAPKPPPGRISPKNRIALTWKVEGKSSVKIQFNALAVDVQDNWIHLMIDPDFNIIPSDVMELTLTCLNKVYPVMLIGGSFRFPLEDKSISGITFLRKNDDQNGHSDDGQNTESGQRQTS